MEPKSHTEHPLDQCATTICIRPAGHGQSPECDPYCGPLCHHGISGVYDGDSQDHSAPQETQRCSDCSNGSVWHHALDSICVGQGLPAGCYRIPGRPHLWLLPRGKPLQHLQSGTERRHEPQVRKAHCPCQSSLTTGSEASLTNISNSLEAG